MLGAGGGHHEVGHELEQPECHDRQEAPAVAMVREDREARDLDHPGRAQRRRQLEVLLGLERARRARRHPHRADGLAGADVLGQEEPGAAIVLVGDRDVVAAGVAVDLAADLQGAGDRRRVLADAEAVAAEKPGENGSLLVGAGGRVGVLDVVHCASPGRLPKQPLCTLLGRNNPRKSA